MNNAAVNNGKQITETVFKSLEYSIPRSGTAGSYDNVYLFEEPS